MEVAGPLGAAVGLAVASGLSLYGAVFVSGLAIRLGWDRVHPALRLTKPFYERFIPAIRAGDFRLRTGDLDRALDFLAICRA